MVNRKRYLSYKESKEFCKLKNIKSKTDWFNNKDNIHNGKIVPSNPNRFYSEWTSWYDFLEKEKKNFNYFTYNQYSL